MLRYIYDIGDLNYIKNCFR